jgi:hypothetical protein
MNSFTQKNYETMPILNSCARIPLLRECAPWNRQSNNFGCFVARWALVTRNQIMYPENTIPFDILLYSILTCQDAYFQMLHEQQQTILMRSNVREWTRVLLAKTPYFIALLLRIWREQRPRNQSDLDSRPVMGGGVGWVYYTGWACIWFHFCILVGYMFVVEMRFKRSWRHVKNTFHKAELTSNSGHCVWLWEHTAAHIIV